MCTEGVITELQHIHFAGEVHIVNKPAGVHTVGPPWGNDYWILLLSVLRVLASRAAAGRGKPSREHSSAW